MEDNKNQIPRKYTFIAASIFALAVVSRLLPHAPNFTPMEAISLFAGAYLARGYWKFIIPLGAIYITDFILNNTVLRSFFPATEGIVWYSNYMLWNGFAMMGIVLIGWAIRKKINGWKVLGGAISACVLFFILSNLGVWISSPMYTKDIFGLLMCFELALPFFRTSLASTLVFSFLMFGTYEYILRSRQAPVKV